MATEEHEDEGGDENGSTSLFPCKHMIPTPGMVIRGTVPLPGAGAEDLEATEDDRCLDPNAAGTQPTVFLKYAGGLGAIDLYPETNHHDTNG